MFLEKITSSFANPSGFFLTGPNFFSNKAETFMLDDQILFSFFQCSSERSEYSFTTPQHNLLPHPHTRKL